MQLKTCIPGLLRAVGLIYMCNPHQNKQYIKRMEFQPLRGGNRKLAIYGKKLASNLDSHLQLSTIT